MLVAGERLVGMRPGALLERRQPAPGRRATSGLEGTLYLTTRRIILAGRSSLSFGLDTIRDVMLTGDQLLVLLCDGQGLTLRVPQPRLLRVELAAARLADQVAREGQPAAR